MGPKFMRNKGFYLGSLVLLLLFQSLVFAEVIRVKVIVKWGNVHQQPSPESRVITRVSKDSVLKVLAEEGEWFKVQLDKQADDKVFAGYVHKKTVKVIGESKKAAEPPQEVKIKPAKEPATTASAGRSKKVPSLVKPKDLLKLQKLSDIMRRDSVAFLTLVKKMLPQEGSGYRMITVETAKIIRDNCRVFESEYDESKVIFHPRLNDEFEVLESRELLYKIQLQDGRRGWIKKDDVQLTTQQRRGEKIRLTGISQKDVRKFISVAADIYSRIVVQKVVADGIAKKYRVKPGNQLVSDRRLRSIYSRIQKYHQYSHYFYQKFVRDENVLLGKKTLDRSRISAWAELLLGSSSYSTNYLLLGEEKNSGLTRSISVGGDLVMNRRSTARFSLSNQRDVIQTPFNTTSVSAGYNYTDNKRWRINSGISFDMYADEANDLNDFNRLNVQAQADYDLNEKTDIYLNYSFLNHNFSNDGDNSYTSQAVLAGGRYLLNPSSTLDLQLRTLLQSSDSAFHQFTDIMPSLTYDLKSANNRFQARLMHEALSFSEMEIKNFNRTMLWFNNHNSRRGLNSRINFAFTYKTYPNNNNYDYVQLWGEYSASRFGKKQLQSSVSFYSNLFTRDSTNSFTDVKFNFGHTSTKFFTQFSTFFKIWHTPRPEDGSGLLRPYIFDVYLNLGINTPNIRFGPTFGLHFLLSSEKGVKVWAREGNVVRVGANCEIRVPLPNRILLQVNGSYEYGSVYHDQLEVDNATGALTPGEALMAHPTTLQVNGILTVPLAGKFELVSRVNYYMINTDMDQAVSINPLEYNQRFMALLGVRYRTH